MSAERLPQMLSVREVAARCDMTPRTIWKWASEGKFPRPVKLAAQVTRWYEEEVNDWLKAKEAASRLHLVTD